MNERAAAFPQTHVEKCCVFHVDLQSVFGQRIHGQKDRHELTVMRLLCKICAKNV